MFIKTQIEKTRFLFALDIIIRDRKLKVMILSIMSTGTFIPLLIVIRFKYSDFPMNNPHMWVYFTIFSCSMFSQILLKAEYFKGVQKALLLKYVSVVVTIVFVSIIFIQGIECLLDLLYMLLLLLILVRIDSYIYADRISFSEDLANIHTEKGLKFVQLMCFMIILGILI